MSRTAENVQRDILRIQSDIREGLSSIETDENWLEKYEEWSKQDKNQFDALLEIKDPFDLSCDGDSYKPDPENEIHVNDMEIKRMAVFLSETLLAYTKETFAIARSERNRGKKCEIISNYFNVTDYIKQSPKLSPCIIELYKCAEGQMILHGQRIVDLYLCYSILEEGLRKRSTEALYLLFTYWRITKRKKDLKRVVESLIDYIRTYFYDFGNDPEMRLSYPMEGLMIINKLPVIIHWLEHIALKTSEISEKYKELDWAQPVDILADEFIPSAQISRHEMLQYKRLFFHDDNETVRKKAICNQGYAIWIRTVDVMYIVCDLLEVLYHFTEDELKKMHASKAIALELYDNMTKVRDFYTRKIFFHQVYYKLERNYLDSKVMEALEDDADLISESIEDVLNFTNAFASDDVEGLMQAKQKYIARLAGFVSKEQEEKLDKLTYTVVEKIKEAVRQKDLYEELYESVSDGFKDYAGDLMKHPELFNTLVSAEYLYKQYVEDHDPKESFDYSCISIMYYMALEDFANKLVYTPYFNKVLKTVQKDDWKDYVTSATAFWDRKNASYKRTCEIGNLGFLFNGVRKRKNFKSFMEKSFGEVELRRLSSLGQELIDIAPRRNNAAHGGNYLTYDDVRTDKTNVYAVSVERLRGLIKELLEILYKK